jgi:hypothetical protein
MVARELESGRLVSWGKLADKKAEIWILFPSRRFQSAKITAFVETFWLTTPARSAIAIRLAWQFDFSNPGKRVSAD